MTMRYSVLFHVHAFLINVQSDQTKQNLHREQINRLIMNLSSVARMLHMERKCTPACAEVKFTFFLLHWRLELRESLQPKFSGNIFPVEVIRICPDSLSYSFSDCFSWRKSPHALVLQHCLSCNNLSLPVFLQVWDNARLVIKYKNIIKNNKINIFYWSVNWTSCLKFYISAHMHQGFRGIKIDNELLRVRKKQILYIIRKYLVNTTTGVRVSKDNVESLCYTFFVPNQTWIAILMILSPSFYHSSIKKHICGLCN